MWALILPSAGAPCLRCNCYAGDLGENSSTFSPSPWEKVGDEQRPLKGWGESHFLPASCTVNTVWPHPFLGFPSKDLKLKNPCWTAAADCQLAKRLASNYLK